MGGNGEVVPATTSVADVTYGKRRRNAEESYGNIWPVVPEDYEGPLHKRVRALRREASGRTMKAAQPMTRTHRRPETRVPTTRKK